MTDNKKFIDYFFVIALFFFGLYYYCFRIVGLDLAYTPGDYGDSRFINYVLEHGFRWLKGEDPDFWRAGFMYPIKNNIAISDSMAGALPVYALFRFMRFDTETAYQLWWISICILNFWCCFIAFKKLGFHVLLAAAGAYVFAFGINNFNQFVHLQFSCKFFIPIAVAAIYLFLNRPTLKYAIIFVLSTVLQFYASAYLGLMVFYFSLTFAGLYLLWKTNRERFLNAFTKKLLIQISVTVFIGTLLLLLVALPYREMAQALGYRSYKNETLPSIQRVYSYVFAPQSSVTWKVLATSPLMEIGNWYLYDLFPGGFCYLGIVIALVWLIIKRIRKERVSYLPVVLLLIPVIFTLMFTKTESDFSLFIVFRHLPGMKSMRLMTRFMIIAVFFMLWLTLYFISLFAKKKSSYLYLIVALLAIADNLFEVNHNVLSYTPKKVRQERIDNMVAKITQQNTDHRKVVACINVIDDADAYMQLDVMLACQRLNLKTFNGYSSTCYGDLCGVFYDTTHVGLLNWMKRYYIKEQDVLFITNK